MAKPKNNNLPYSVRIKLYEAEKAELQTMGLNAQEYARQVNKLAKKYNI